MAIEIRPGRLAMEHHHRRAIPGAFVDEMHAQSGVDIQVVGAKGIIRKACEAGFVGSQNTHAIDCPD
jgi:hypothetical protein